MKDSVFSGLRLGARSQGAKLTDALKTLAGLDPERLSAAIEAVSDDNAHPSPDPNEEIVEEAAVERPEPAGEPSADDPAPAVSETFADGVASERARTKAVLLSEHFAGREAMAAELLDTDLSADRIVATLGKAPKAASADGILGALASGGAPDLGGAPKEPDARQAADDVWARARERNAR